MRSINTRFIILVLALATVFSGAIFYQTWYSSRAQMEEQMASEADLALEFSLAIRQYVAESIWPAAQQRIEKDEFIPELMVPWFAVRYVFEKVSRRFPDHVIKFSSDNPKNPMNRACPEAIEILEYFRNNPEATRWSGKIRMNGKDYLGHFSAVRMEASCLRCHGRPEDAPKELLSRYGPDAGFHWRVGEVIATDTVAIPMERVNAASAKQIASNLGTLAVWMVLLLVSVFLVFRSVVTRRLSAIADNFRQALEQEVDAPFVPIAVTHRDEIGALASSFNALAARQHTLHHALEQRVKERTGELESEVLERKRTEDALRKSEERFSLAMRGANDGLWDWNLEEGKVYYSPRWKNMLGYEPQEVGDCLDEWKNRLHPDDRDRAIKQVEDYQQEREKSFEVEFRMRHKDGNYVNILSRAFAVRDADGKPLRMIGTHVDITERKRAVEALNRLNRELEQRVERRTAQLQIELEERKKAETEREQLIEELEAKNNELERFAYTVSHDLKSPLITIRGHLGLLMQDIAEENAERVKADMACIFDATGKMHQLLSEVLELSRVGRQVNPPQSVPMEDLATEAIGLLAGGIAQRNVEVVMAPDLPLLYGDRSRLREVLQNLIENAVKSMGDQPRPRIEIGARLDDGQTVCYVRDNGIGIEACYHEKIFSLFEKLDSQSEGTGVGLALVKRIVEVHGGQIWVESEGPGTGATFCFTIPAE